MSRKNLQFMIQVQSALHIGQGLQNVGEYHFTGRHIPGSTLRGALANAYIRHLGTAPESEDFEAIFAGPDAIRFEPALPTTGSGKSYPLPLTARQCKDYGGFPPYAKKKEDRPYHGAFDILAEQMAFEEHLSALESQGLLFLNTYRCPHKGCSGKVDPPDKGGYTWFSDASPRALPNVQLVRHTHTAINRARNVAEDGMLYTLETIEPETVLEGCLWAPEAHLDSVKRALSEITHLGRGAHRGQGRVAVKPNGEARMGNTRTRIEELTNLIREARSFYKKLLGDDAEMPTTEGYYFTLDLLAPAIFGEGHVATLHPPVLDVGADVSLVRSFVTPTVVGGWWSAARLPYPTALAAQTGSVFLYHVPPGTDLDDLSKRLDNLRAEGLGQRRERGYGAFIPCAPFHLWTAAKEVNRL